MIETDGENGRNVGDVVDLAYHEASGLYHTRHDWSSPHSLSTTVTVAVAAVVGTTPLDIESLHRSLNPEALDDLYEPRLDGSPYRPGHVSLSLAGHDVTIHSDGLIVIHPEGTRGGRADRP